MQKKEGQNISKEGKRLYEIFYRLIYGFSSAAAAAKSLQSCPTLCDPIDSSPPGSPCPWDSPGKNTGVGCHFFLQCMKVKSESEVAQLYPTLSDPMDCSLPGSSIHGIFQARVLEWGAIAFSGFSSTPLVLQLFLHSSGVTTSVECGLCTYTQISLYCAYVVYHHSV